MTPKPKKNPESRRGRSFAKGNPGRPRGSKNRSTAIAQQLLTDEKTELFSKAFELAKSSDVQMLKFLLDRILPRDRLIPIEIPRLDSADDAIDAMDAINRAIAQGEITPSEAAALSTMVTGWARALDVRELSKRIDELEASLNPREEI